MFLYLIPFTLVLTLLNGRMKLISIPNYYTEKAFQCKFAFISCQASQYCPLVRLSARPLASCLPVRLSATTIVITFVRMKKIIFTISLVLISAFAFCQWITQNPLPQSNWLTSVYFIDSDTGFSVGDFGTILKTTDGGSTWSGVPSGTTNHLWSDRKSVV